MARSKSDDTALSAVMIEILITLSGGPRHGYAIKRDIEERVGGEFVLGSGSLYQALQRLERRQLVTGAETGTGDDARRGRTYTLAPAGRGALEGELSRMSRVLHDAKAYGAGRPREAS